MQTLWEDPLSRNGNGWLEALRMSVWKARARGQGGERKGESALIFYKILLSSPETTKHENFHWIQEMCQLPVNTLTRPHALVMPTFHREQNTEIRKTKLLKEDNGLDHSLFHWVLSAIANLSKQEHWCPGSHDVSLDGTILSYTTNQNAFVLTLALFVQSEHWKRENSFFWLPFLMYGTSTLSLLNPNIPWIQWR